MVLINTPSPNFNDRRLGNSPSLVVLHYTGMHSANDALERLCDPAAQVSAHYLVDEDGTCHKLVAEEKRAWHAGVAYWRGERDINSASIGIELVNPGHEWGYRAFPDPQIESLRQLLSSIIQRHSIAAQNVIGHSDVAPGRKTDPGELFPWDQLAQAGLARATPPLQTPVAPEDIAHALHTIGYAHPNDPGKGSDILPQEAQLDAVLDAFCRRWCPAELGKGATETVRAHLAALT